MHRTTDELMNLLLSKENLTQYLEKNSSEFLQSSLADYVSTVFYVLAGLIGLLTAGSYADLNVWSVLSLIFGAICVVTTRKQNGRH